MRRSMGWNPNIDGPTWVRLFEILPSTKIEALECVWPWLSFFGAPFVSRYFYLCPACASEDYQKSQGGIVFRKEAPRL